MNPKDEKAVVMRRLAFIKYLHGVGAAQSRLPEPSCCAAVLMFHDAAELFLHLAAETLCTEVEKRISTFEQYFDVLSKARPPHILAHRVSMSRLNGIRNQLKHHGTLPSLPAVEDMRLATAAFLQDNCPVLFGPQFSDVSLALLVENRTARDHLTKAEKLTGESNFGAAIEQAAIAFAFLVAGHAEAGSDVHALSSSLGMPLSGRFSLRHEMRRTTEAGIPDFVADRIDHAFDTLGKTVGDLRHTVMLLTLGVDPVRHQAFRALTPHIEPKEDETYFVLRQQPLWDDETRPGSTDARFCVDFVIEVALLLQRRQSRLPG